MVFMRLTTEDWREERRKNRHEESQRRATKASATVLAASK
jgi:hypothetical protein